MIKGSAWTLSARLFSLHSKIGLTLSKTCHTENTLPNGFEIMSVNHFVGSRK